MSENLACRHLRTQLIAKDKDAEYVECLECGAIFEPQELAAPAKREITDADGPK